MTLPKGLEQLCSVVEIGIEPKRALSGSASFIDSLQTREDGCGGVGISRIGGTSRFGFLQRQECARWVVGLAAGEPEIVPCACVPRVEFDGLLELERTLRTNSCCALLEILMIRRRGR